MNPKLKDQLINTVPREQSGPRSFNRFTYQNSWGLCHLLELHEAGDDYLIAFDYHDDVIVLDSPVNPKWAKFYQVKTRNKGEWTISRLMQQKKNADGSLKLSYLGKLYHHVLTFPDSVNGLIFISNANFIIKLVNGKDSTAQNRLPFKDVAKETKDLVAQKLNKEHGRKIPPAELELFCLEVTPLSLNDHSAHTLGHVADFLSRHLNKLNIPAKPFHQALSGEIERRAGCEVAFSDWSDFCDRRALHRIGFQELLSSIEAQTNFEDVYHTMLPRLDTEGISFREREEIRKALREYEIDVMDGTNTLVHNARKAVKKVIESLKSSKPNELEQLLNLLTLIAQDAEPDIRRLIKVKGVPYIKAIGLLCIYEN